jgi:hypothetical protein
MRHHSDETNQRQKSILRGAFAGPPTPLKDIPKRNGESRSLKRKSEAKTRPALRDQNLWGLRLLAFAAPLNEARGLMLEIGPNEVAQAARANEARQA